jgi:hypothetical protein
MFFSTFEFRKPCTRTSAAGSIEQVPSINSILVYKGKAGKKE